MNDLDVTLPMLDVPYFQQTRPGTCGPASLMMVMKYWDKSFELSRRIEFKLWIKSNPFVFFGGTLQFGLARTAAGMGFKTKIHQKARLSEYHSTMPRFFNFLVNLAAFGTRLANEPIYYGREVLEVIHEALINRVPPIVFLNLEPILGENVLHWLVVTGLDGQKVYVNDPYIPEQSELKMKKGYPIDLESFRKAIATDSGRNLRLPPCTVLVYK
ncbi:MAG: peptidase C39 family protein [Thermoplasmatales archaeon]|nr:MAG: peptidase C39 family protein [Thermoplasmatales archaeon]